MIQALKIRTLNNWHAMRWLRLAVGLSILGSGLQGSEGVVIALGSLLSLQAVLNMGCTSCASGTCSFAADQMVANQKEK